MTPRPRDNGRPVPTIPTDVAAERVLLACLIVGPRADVEGCDWQYADVLTHVRPDMVSVKDHARILAAIVRLLESRQGERQAD